MKRTPLILTLGSLLLIAAAIVIYQTFFNRKLTSVWSIIPDQAVVVYEAGECDECNEQISKTAVGELIRSVANFPQTDSLREVLDFLFFPKKGTLVSIHVINKEDFDFIYYSSQDHKKSYEDAVEILKGINGVKFSERVLNTIKIQEFDFGDKKLSCTELDGIWVGSFTSFLVEDVIRTYVSDEKSSFAKDIREVYSLPRIKNDPGNIYIHLSNFTRWLEVFNEIPLKDLPSLGQASLLDVKLNDNSIVLNGFSLTRKNSSTTLLSYFDRQLPTQFTLKQYFSSRTAFAVNYGISDGSVFYNDVLKLRNSDIRDSLTSLVKFDHSKLFSSIGDEFAMCYQESKGGFSKVILFETSKPKDWIEVLNQLSQAAEMEDTIFYEKYSTYEIREIEINNLPGKLFGPLTSGFSQTYYTSIGNTIILAEQLEQIKEFVNDIDQEDVWGKSVAINKFLESTLLESNVSVYINTPLVWSALSNKLNPRWKSFISDNQSIINAFGMGAIQFSHLNEGFYTNLTLNYSSSIDDNDEGHDKLNKLVTNLTSSIVGKPFIVRSHVSKDDEILVQDSTHMLYHIDSEGKVLWSKMIDGPIVGDVNQVDFFKNGKLQFLLATPKKLHVIDRLGNYVNPFPADIKVSEAEFVKVIDYDNSKNYRFLVADKTGKVWMYDKNLQGLEGWKPKNLESGLYTEAAHHRIRGKDYLVAIRKDGLAFLMNRRGENIKGFPIDLDARLDGEYYVETGNAFNTTYFVCISKDGYRLKFNLEGKILSRETLVKPTFNTQFSLIKERSSKSYLIKRQDAKQLTILNENTEEILTNKFVGTNPVDVKYYDFGAGKIFISITDLTQDLSFIYDEKGKLLTQTPIEGEFIELRPGLNELPKLFIVNNKSLVIQE